MEEGVEGEWVIKAVLEDNAELGIDTIVKTKKVCPICRRLFIEGNQETPHRVFCKVPPDFTTLINVWRFTRSL